MARPKSPTGKPTRASNKAGSNPEQTIVSAQPSIPVKPLAAEPAQMENKTAAEVKAEPRKIDAEPRKLEVVKSEPRKNILPINLEEEIRRRAYELYQQRGNRVGGEADDWFAAESEIRQRYRQQSA
jgi:Protein of unknown function (DUF2934)